MNLDSPRLRHRPARLRERWRDVTRDAILAAAERALAAEGPGRARMARIAAHAGVSVGTLYNHFRDRDALVAALLERRRAELFERVDRAIAATRGGREPRLAAAVGAVFEHCAEHQPFLSIVAQGETARRLRRPAPQAPSPTLEGLRARFESLVPARAADEPAVLADLLTGMLRATLVRVLATRAPFDPRREAERVVRVFLDGARP